MKYNTAVNLEAQKAFAYLAALTGKQYIVEVKKITPKRSLPQNSYLHLLIGMFSLETGNRLQDTKDLYKWVNRDLYYSKKKIGGEVFVTVRSSADLDKDEMTKSIERWREWAAEQGYPLPSAMTSEEVRSLENAMEQSKYLL